MERESFIFYRSVGEVALQLSDEDRLKYYDRVIKYGLFGEDKDCGGIVDMMFTLIKPNIDANNKKFIDGSKGGRPRKKPLVSGKKNHRFSEKKPNVDDNVDDNDNVNDNIILSEQEIKQHIIDIYTEDIILKNPVKYRLLVLFIMKGYNIVLDKKSCDKFFADMIDKSHRYGYSGEGFADWDTLLLKAKEMYEWSEGGSREIKNHMSTINKFLSPNSKK